MTVLINAAVLALHLIFQCLPSLFIIGSLDVGPQDQKRPFLSYPHCRESLDLNVGKTYLVMGTSKDIHKDNDKL